MSATPIPGNETVINKTIDNLFRQGARVLYGQIADVHVHGHGGQEELKMMLAMTRPQFFVPIHGEYRHLALHSKLAESFGIAKENIFTLEDGQILELSPDKGRVNGKLPSGNVYVDGLGVGDIDHVILRDRWLLSQDGVVAIIVAIDKNTGKIVGHPDIVSRGFVDLEDSEDMIELAKEEVVKVLGRGANHSAELGFIHTKVKEVLGRFFYQQTKRRPMILPIAIEV
jgi:ribonuclease J